MSQSHAFLRLTQVDGKATSDDQDPYLPVGFFSLGQIGTSAYGNEPINILAPPRNNFYPGMRWAALLGSRSTISIALFAEQFNVFATGKIIDLKLVSFGGFYMHQMTMKVDKSGTVPGGMTWQLLNAKKADDSLTFEDFRKMRGWKIARKGAAKVWEMLTD